MKINETEKKFLIRGILFYVILAVFISIIVVLLFGIMNKRLGLDEVQSDDSSFPDSIFESTEVASIIEISESPVEEVIFSGPENSWPQTPCSIFISGGFILDTLPEAPQQDEISLEVYFVIRKWAERNNYSEADVEKVYVFNSADTLYVDLPVSPDIETLKKTLESRFVCFTRMFILFSGSMNSSYPDGIRIRGIAGALP